MMEDLKKLQCDLGYSFKDVDLLSCSISHPSLKQIKNDAKDYERLEFLGDAVLGMIITEAIYIKFYAVDEGRLAKIRAALVCKESICKVAKHLKLEDIMIMTRGEELSGGRSNLNNVENVMEAIIGAIYLDGGLEEARKVVLSLWGELIAVGDMVADDPKSSLQEWSQSRSMSIPRYDVVSREGESHSPTFKVMVTIDDLSPEHGEGRSIKAAEKDAARKLLQRVMT